jgi:hypothetical protein
MSCSLVECRALLLNVVLFLVECRAIPCWMSCSQDSLCLLPANGLLLAATPCLCYSCQGSLVQESYYNLLLLKQPITHYRVTIYWPNLMCPILVTLVRLFLVPCRLLLNPCVLSLVSGLSVLPLPGPDPQALHYAHTHPHPTQNPIYTKTLLTKLSAL